MALLGNGGGHGSAAEMAGKWRRVQGKQGIREGCVRDQRMSNGQEIGSACRLDITETAGGRAKLDCSVEGSRPTLREDGLFSGGKQSNALSNNSNLIESYCPYFDNYRISLI